MQAGPQAAGGGAAQFQGRRQGGWMGGKALEQELAPAGLLAAQAVERISTCRTLGKTLPKALPEVEGLVGLAGGLGRLGGPFQGQGGDRVKAPALAPEPLAQPDAAAGLAAGEQQAGLAAQDRIGAEQPPSPQAGRGRVRRQRGRELEHQGSAGQQRQGRAQAGAQQQAQALRRGRLGRRELGQQGPEHGCCRNRVVAIVGRLVANPPLHRHGSAPAAAPDAAAIAHQPAGLAPTPPGPDGPSRGRPGAAAASLVAPGAAAGLAGGPGVVVGRGGTGALGLVAAPLELTQARPPQGRQSLTPEQWVRWADRPTCLVPQAFPEGAALASGGRQTRAKVTRSI